MREMKVLLYAKNEKIVSRSGVGRAIFMQKNSLKAEDVELTFNPQDDFDIVHLNTVFPSDYRMAKRAKRAGKKVVYHAHSTKEDFQNSFMGSNLAAPLFKWWIKKCYQTADLILTPTEYAKSLLNGYGIRNPIAVISNGVDTCEFQKNALDRESFRRTYGFRDADKIVMSVGLYFERKGILDFVELAGRMPEYQFIWFGYTPELQIPKKVRDAIHTNLPNLTFAGYVPKEELKKAYSSCDLFLFPSYEETEGIVVLEALASQIPVILRDILVYRSWLQNGRDVYKCRNNDEFWVRAHQVLQHQLPLLTDSGRARAKERDILCQAKKLKYYYSGLCSKNA